MIEEGASLDEETCWDPVHLEHEWYDGPVAGIADVRGQAHYFRRVNDFNRGDGTDAQYRVWPAPPEAVALEVKNWSLFVAWNERYESGQETVATHPGQGGVNHEYDDVESRLAGHRTPPGSARRVTATWKPLDRPRYAAEGPAYLVHWNLVAETAEAGCPNDHDQGSS